ncbi:hypothetical protein D9M72_564010 [compost metagenome]
MLSRPKGCGCGSASAAVMTPPTSIATRLATGKAQAVAMSELLRSAAQRLKSAVTVPASMNSATTMVSPMPKDIGSAGCVPAYESTLSHPAAPAE